MRHVVCKNQKINSTFLYQIFLNKTKIMPEKPLCSEVVAATGTEAAISARTLHTASFYNKTWLWNLGATLPQRSRNPFIEQLTQCE